MTLFTVFILYVGKLGQGEIKQFTVMTELIRDSQDFVPSLFDLTPFRAFARDRSVYSHRCNQNASMILLVASLEVKAIPVPLKQAEWESFCVAIVFPQ